MTTTRRRSMRRPSSVTPSPSVRTWRSLAQPAELAPNEAAYLNNRSAAYMMLGKFEEAVRDSQSAVMLESTNSKVCHLSSLCSCGVLTCKFHHRAAKCYVSLWRLTDAQRHYHEVLRLDESNGEAQKEVLHGIAHVAHAQVKNVEQLFALERNVNDSFANQLFNNAISLLVWARAPARTPLHELTRSSP